MDLDDAKGISMSDALSWLDGLPGWPAQQVTRLDRHLTESIVWPPMERKWNRHRVRPCPYQQPKARPPKSFQGEAP